MRSFECAAHLAVLTDFLAKPDLPNRPHRNLFRSVSSFPPAFFSPLFLNLFIFFRSCLPEQEQAVDIDRLQCIEVVAESLRASWSGC